MAPKAEPIHGELFFKRKNKITGRQDHRIDRKMFFKTQKFEIKTESEFTPSAKPYLTIFLL